MGHTEGDAAGVGKGGDFDRLGSDGSHGFYFLVSASVPGLVCWFVVLVALFGGSVAFWLHCCFILVFRRSFICWTQLEVMFGFVV